MQTKVASPGLEDPARRALAELLPARSRVPASVLKRTLTKAWSDRILGLSAEAAFWQLLSLPPLLLALLGSLGYLPSLVGPDALGQVEARAVDLFSGLLTPEVVSSTVEPTIDQVLRSGRPDLVSVGFLIALWAGSSAMATFVNTITIAYDQRDVRGPVRSRLLALWLFIAFLATGAASLPLLLLGPEALLGWFGPGTPPFVTTLITLIYPIVVCLIIVVVLTSLYFVVLPRKIRWRRHLPGALFAMIIFTLGAWGLRIYVGHYFAALIPYGALAAPVAALLFCFLLGLSVLLGAELNAAVQQRWPASPRRIDLRRSARAAMEAERSGVTLLSL